MPFKKKTDFRGKMLNFVSNEGHVLWTCASTEGLVNGRKGVKRRSWGPHISVPPFQVSAPKPRGCHPDKTDTIKQLATFFSIFIASYLDWWGEGSKNLLRVDMHQLLSEDGTGGCFFNFDRCYFNTQHHCNSFCMSKIWYMYDIGIIICNMIIITNYATQYWHWIQLLQVLSIRCFFQHTTPLLLNLHVKIWYMQDIIICNMIIITNHAKQYWHCFVTFQ